MSQPVDPAQRRRRWRPGPDTAIACVALAVAAGGGGYALGAVAGGSTVTACLDAAGTPKKIVTTGDCAPLPGTTDPLTPVSWNQVGPQGQQGPIGPAGKDAGSEPTVISLPPVPKRERRGTFIVGLQLPGPGTYLLEGHVDWTRLALTADAVAKCRILRNQPTALLDSLNIALSRNGPYGGEIDENGLTTVVAPAPSSGPVQQRPTPVFARFTCRAYRSATSDATNTKVTFRDWTFTATPVKVSVIKKP